MLNTNYMTVSAVSHVTGIKIELLDRTLKMPLVQGHTVVFGQNICYIRKEYDLFYLKSAGSYLMLFVKYS